MLLKNSADVNEMGVASIGEDPEGLEGRGCFESY